MSNLSARDFVEDPLEAHPLRTAAGVLSNAGVDEEVEDDLTKRPHQNVQKREQARRPSPVESKPLVFDGDDPVQIEAHDDPQVSEGNDRVNNRFVEVNRATDSNASQDDPLRETTPPAPDASKKDEEELSQEQGLQEPIADEGVHFIVSRDVKEVAEDAHVSFSEPDTSSISGFFKVMSKVSVEDSDTVTSGWITVQRSLADFVWLDERLRARYEGALIPTLPVNDATTRIRLGAAYPESRRRELEKFLRKIVGHGTLGKTEELNAFRGLLDVARWRSLRDEPIKRPGDAAIAMSLGIRPSQNFAEKLIRWIGYRFWQMGRRLEGGLDYVLNKGRDDGVIARDVTSRTLEQLEENFEALGKSLVRLRNGFRSYSMKRNESFIASLEVQESLQAFAAQEDDESSPFWKTVASAMELRERDLYRDQRSSCLRPHEAKLIEVLERYANQFEDVRRILRRRFTEREAYEHAADAYANTRKKLEKKIAGSWSSSADGQLRENADVTRLRILTNHAALNLSEVRRHYQEVINATYYELVFYRRSLKSELHCALKGVTEEHIAYLHDQTKAWENVLQEISKFDENIKSQKEDNLNRKEDL